MKVILLSLLIMGGVEFPAPPVDWYECGEELMDAVDNLTLRCDTTTKGLKADLERYIKILKENDND